MALNVTCRNPHSKILLTCQGEQRPRVGAASPFVGWCLGQVHNLPDCLFKTRCHRTGVSKDALLRG